MLYDNGQHLLAVCFCYVTRQRCYLIVIPVVAVPPHPSPLPKKERGQNGAAFRDRSLFVAMLRSLKHLVL
ncbi:hypothetical protein A6U95_16420 [Serratia sp. 14-2641]|nr:hypothetical protein A6U95_16420 [Serratia sp. 14-2641]